MLTSAVPTSAYLILILTLQGSNPQPLENGGQGAIQIVENNKLVQTTNPNAAILEISRKIATKGHDNRAIGAANSSKTSNSWDDQTLNQKLMQQRLDERSKLKSSNVNIYDTGDLLDGENQLLDLPDGHIPHGVLQPSTAASKGSASALFQQIAAVSQMKNRFKPNPGGKSGNVGTRKNQTSGSPNRTQSRSARKIDPLDESIRPLYGVSAYGEATPIKLCKRSVTSSDAPNPHDMQSHGNEVDMEAKDANLIKVKIVKKKKKYPKRRKRRYHKVYYVHGRKRRSIKTEYVSKKPKDHEFITSIKMSPPPPIVRVIPNEPLYYRHGRAGEKQFTQSYDRDVQELIRHNVQHYVQAEVSPNGNNDYLNRAETPNRYGNQRRIVYYATLPEIVRRPSNLLQESPYWTNYMVPRELSGSSKHENGVIKVHSNILDVQDSTKTLIPIKTISPQQASDQSLTRSDNGNVQPAPYYNGPYPMRHNRYPPLTPTLPPIRPINYDYQSPSNYANSIPNPQPKPSGIHSPKSYELNGKRYGIYDIPSLSDNAIKPFFDDGRSYNNKFSNYEKFYKVPGTFDKPLEEYDDSIADFENDFDWGPLGANTRQTQSYSLKFVPQSVTYLPHNVVKTLDAASSSSYKNDVVGKHSSNVVHSVTVETSSSNNGTLETPGVRVNEKNSTVTYESSYKN